jgi:hypothetical protein
MKKLSVLILLVIVASLLVAAIPTKMMRLTIINKSGYDVYMKLEGSPITDAYYYLTVPSGDRDNPVIRVFTVMSDMYDRTTWQCGGLESTGQLAVTGNIRLTYTPCGEALCKIPVENTEDLEVITKWKCGHPVSWATPDDFVLWFGRQGEPTMEKVTYWKWVSFDENFPKNNTADGYWNWGCFQYYWDLETYKLPTGCNFRYQY